VNNNDKEFLLAVLDDVAVVLAQYEVPGSVWDKISRAMTIVERSYYKLDDEKKPADELEFNDWHGEEDRDYDGV
jgi:hypothetical protein